LKDNTELAAKLEDQIRKNAGIVADAMLAGPDSADSAEDAADGAVEETANDEDVGKKGGRKAAG